VGDDNRVRLADFGIARIMGDMVRHTATGFTMGTAAYVAPEQVQGRDVTTAADIYSLGLVLLEALTSEVSFRGTAAEVALARLNKPPELPATLSANWRGLLSQMTSIEPSARPDADAVRSQLGQIGMDDGEGTQPLEQTATRPLTTPIATIGEVQTEAIAEAAPVRPPAPATATQAFEPVPAALAGAASAVVDNVGSTLASAMTKLRQRWRQLSPRSQLLAVGIAILVVVLCVIAVTSLVTSSTSKFEVPPGVPDEIGQDLQQLHKAVTG
jgi:serine/threonine protein kinase